MVIMLSTDDMTISMNIISTKELGGKDKNKIKKKSVQAFVQAHNNSNIVQHMEIKLKRVHPNCTSNSSHCNNKISGR